MILLDTHALIWWLKQSPHLSPKASKAIEAEIGKSRILVSTISVWEICLLIRSGRLPISCPLDQYLLEMQKLSEFQFVPIDFEIAHQSTNLEWTHKDPADRFIVATAIKSGATLITKDTKIRKYKHIETIW